MKRLLVTLPLLLVGCAQPAETPEPTAPEPTVTTTSTTPEPPAPAPTTPSTTPSTTITATATETSATALAPLGQPDTARQENWDSLTGELHVTGYRIGEHERFDRLVFDLAGDGEPGWFIEYTEKPLQQASGFPVEYEGATALHVIITGTPYPMGDDSGLLAHGPHPGGGVINGVTFASLFEAHSEFVIGLDQEYPYSVTFLEGPKRLVIDLIKEPTDP